MEVSDKAVASPGARRCAVCHTGRRWREFELVEGAGGDPVLMCPACRARQATTAPTPSPVAASEPASSPEPASDAQAVSKSQGAPSSQSGRGSRSGKGSQPAKPRSEPSEDRLRKALREMSSGEHAVAQIAKAAGLNHDKTLRRLHALQDAGEIHQVGNRWSNRPPSTDLDAAMDRLREQTSNLRIVERRSN